MTRHELPTIVLFGSAARGDNDPQSDIDILILENDTYPKSSKNGAVEIQKLSKLDAKCKAVNGDLFMLHVVHEGKVIADPGGFFPALRESFIIKKSYSRERNEALLLASFIEANWSEFKDIKLLNKRIAWSVRTIVISQLVEDGRIIFSPSGICDAVRELDISPLIDLRRSCKHPAPVIPELKEFLLLQGGSDFMGMDKEQIIKEIMSLGKSVALSTLRGLLLDSQDWHY